MTTWIHKIKCLECSLHFSVYSWKEDWRPTHCPECGNSGRLYLQWLSQTEKQGYEFVPGESELVYLGTEVGE